MREDRFIIKVVEMHYIQGMSQVEISQRLGVSRTTVSRTLAQARQRRYIEFKVNYPDTVTPGSESNLEQKFGLKEAVVVTEKSDSDMDQEIAFFASDYLFRVMKNHMTLAYASGRALKNLADCMKNDVRLKFLELSDVKVVPLIATYNAAENVSMKHRMAYSNYSMDLIAQLLEGRVYHLLMPPIVSSKQIRDDFFQEPSIREIVSRIERADVAVVGIGTLQEESAGIYANMIGMEEFDRLSKKGGVSEFLLHVIDKDGQIVDDEYEYHVSSINLEKFKKIPIRIGVAYGMEKKEAILASLRGGLINVLITDEHVAEYLAEV